MEPCPWTTFDLIYILDAPELLRSHSGPQAPSRARTCVMVTGVFNASWEPTWDASLAPTKLRDGHLSPGFLDTNTKKQHLTVKVGQRCVTLAPILYTPILYTPN